MIKKFKLWESNDNIDEVEESLKKALDSKWGESVSDEWIGKAKSSKYHLYGDYFIYGGKIIKWSCRPSGNWYSTELNVQSITIEEMEKNINDKIEELEEALKKIQWRNDD
jgi:hypothetical protein